MAKSKRIEKPPDTYTGCQTEWDALTSNKQYYIVNKVKFATRNRIRNAKHPGKKAAYMRLYRLENPDKVRAGNLKWKTENIESVKSIQKAYSKKYAMRKRELAQRPESKAKMKVICAKYHIKNKEKVAKRGLAYRNANRQKETTRGLVYRKMNRPKIIARGRAYSRINRLLIYAKHNTRRRAVTVKKRKALYERIAVAVAVSYKEIAERA